MIWLVVVIVMLAALVFLGLRHPHWFLTIRQHHELFGYFYGGEFIRKEDVWLVTNNVKPWIEVHVDDRIPPGQFILGNLEYASRYIQVIPEDMQFEMLPMDEHAVIRFLAEQRIKMRIERPIETIDVRIVQV